MACILAYQTYVSVDAAAGVPAGCRLDGVVHLHCNDSILSGSNQIGDIVSKSHISVWPITSQLAVYKNAAAGHHAVKLQEQPLIDPEIGPDGLAVPAYAGRQVSTALSAGITPVKLPLNAPVMRHIHRAPTVHTGQLIYRGITQHKLPTIVKATALPRYHRIRNQNTQQKYVFSHVQPF